MSATCFQALDPAEQDEPHDERSGRLAASAIGALAHRTLCLEIETWPKPGLVSHVDSGSHRDMDADLLLRSAGILRSFFEALATAGAEGAGMDRLRAIGVAAEAAMLVETGGVNAHRGAIFGLGLLCAAAGTRTVAATARAATLGEIVRRRWSDAIRGGPMPLRSHGAIVGRRYGVTGARGEAAAGFPSVYRIGLPALRIGSRLASGDPEAARVQAIFALIAAIDDTNVLHRGGRAGLAYARDVANTFLASGGVGQPDWRSRAAQIHAAFVAHDLSPGGAADLLAMTLFVDAIETDSLERVS